nr:MAG TPA: hypothetical protein [Caudoviricetes sp.]
MIQESSKAVLSCFNMWNLSDHATWQNTKVLFQSDQAQKGNCFGRLQMQVEESVFTHTKQG